MSSHNPVLSSNPAGPLAATLAPPGGSDGFVEAAVPDALVAGVGAALTATTGPGPGFAAPHPPIAAVPNAASPVICAVVSVEPHLPEYVMPPPFVAVPGVLAAPTPVLAVAHATAAAVGGDGMPAPTYAMAAAQPTAATSGPVADGMQVDGPVDNDGFTVVRSKKRSRLDADTKGEHVEGRVAPHPGRLVGGALSGSSGARVLGVRTDVGENRAGGRARSPRRDGVVPYPGLTARLRMSPLEEGQVPDQRPPSHFGFTTLDGASFAPPVASSPGPATVSRAESVPPGPFTPPPAPRPRNATPGPSAPLVPSGPADREALRALAPILGQENVPPLPAFVRELSSLVRLQALEFLSRLPARIRDAVVGAADSGVVPLPTLVSDFPGSFWPEATQWAETAPWLWAPMPAAPGGVPVDNGDHVMGNEVGPPVLAPLHGLPHLAQLPQPGVGPDVLPAVDIQNLEILPNCVPNGGRQTNRDFPLPRTHGVLQVLPPIEITQTPVPMEGFPRIRHSDPEAPYAGWEVERIRQISALNPDTTVIASVHAPVAIQAGGGWQLVQAVKNFITSICGPSNTFVVPVEIQSPALRHDPDDVHTWAPTSFPVWNLPPGVAPGFIVQQSYSTPGLTIHFFPTTLRLDDHLGRIEGFTSGDVDAITPFIRSRLESDDIQAILRKYITRNPRRNTKPLDAAVRDIVDSLRVEIETLPSTDQPIALIFLDSPADSIDADRAYRKDMKTVHWKSLTYGTGVLIYLPPCRGCGSVTHRTENCPFPDLPGWLGPTHAEVARTSVRPGGRVRGPPAPGRGRGRLMMRG